MGLHIPGGPLDLWSMRLWSIHPRYIDGQGLVALWREGLLAQKVLAGQTKGYKFHPQLIRFRNTKDPMKSIGSYLHFVAEEAARRNYKFDRSKILKTWRKPVSMPVTHGQLKYETKHLLRKLKVRDPARFAKCAQTLSFRAHPLFRTAKGGIEAWERPTGTAPRLSQD